MGSGEKLSSHQPAFTPKKQLCTDNPFMANQDSTVFTSAPAILTLTKWTKL